MNERLASSPAAVWNRKNLPTSNERFSQRSARTVDLAKQLPSAVMGFARQRSGLLMLSLAVVAALGVVWYLAESD